MQPRALLRWLELNLTEGAFRPVQKRALGQTALVNEINVKAHGDRHRDEDIAAMLRLQAGDDSALNELMSRWQKPLISFAERYVGNYDDAVDLAEETFVRVYFNRKRYRPKGKFSSWMFTIAGNLCRNHKRWKARHPEDLIPSEVADAFPVAGGGLSRGSSGSPADAAAERETAQIVREAVDGLPHKLKTVILFHEFQDLPYKEIAEILGCSEKAVETRLYRARQRLRLRLNGRI